MGEKMSTTTPPDYLPLGTPVGPKCGFEFGGERANRSGLSFPDIGSGIEWQLDQA